MTGGTGFIGSHVVEALLKRGAVVTITKRKRSASKLPVALLKKTRALTGDLLDAAFAQKTVYGNAVVIHLAAIKKNIDFHSLHPATILRENIQTTVNVLEASRRNRVQKVLLVSSTVASDPADDSPHFGYAWSKRGSEILAQAYCKEYGMDSSIVRLASVFGPRDNFDPRQAQVIPSLIRRIAARENPLVIWGDGTQHKSFLYVEDAASIILETLEKNTRDVREVCNPKLISIKELAELIMDIEGCSLELRFDALKPTGKNETCFNQKVMRFPKESFRKGLKKTIRWYKNAYGNC